jgi:hypothetical protein
MHELLAIWTETDHTARHGAVVAHYQPDVVFNDPDGTFTGFEGIEAFSDTLQQRFPGNRFELIEEPLISGDALRARWQFGPVTGMDFVLLRDGKVQSLYVFLENRPT